MKRTIPAALYDEVGALVTDIAQPNAAPLDNVDEARTSKAFAKLLALFNCRELSGDSDPFLTETLADFTDDKAEAIRLYNLALHQCVDFPGEATISKRIGLARALIESGRTIDARKQIDIARREAFAGRDSEALEELEELADACRT